MLRRRLPSHRISGSTYLALLRSLFQTVVSSAIMGALFILTAWSCAVNSGDGRLTAIAAFGSVVAILRIAIVVRLRHRFEQPGIDLQAGRAAERLYAAVYLTFAATVGVFGALGLLLCTTEYHMVVAALIVGYGAGVAASISRRPGIGIPAIVLGVAPATCARLGCTTPSICYWRRC